MYMVPFSEGEPDWESRIDANWGALTHVEISTLKASDRGGLFFGQRPISEWARALQGAERRWIRRRVVAWLGIELCDWWWWWDLTEGGARKGLGRSGRRWTSLLLLLLLLLGLFVLWIRVRARVADATLQT